MDVICCFLLLLFFFLYIFILNYVLFGFPLFEYCSGQVNLFSFARRKTQKMLNKIEKLNGKEKRFVLFFTKQKKKIAKKNKNNERSTFEQKNSRRRKSGVCVFWLCRIYTNRLSSERKIKHKQHASSSGSMAVGGAGGSFIPILLLLIAFSSSQ